MSPTEQTTSAASTPKPDHAAMLRGGLRIQGSGPPKRAEQARAARFKHLRASFFTSGKPGPRSKLALLSLPALALACMAFAAAPALAAEGYGLTGSFGAAGSGAGQLEDPQGVVVNDKTKDVYVADEGNHRVDEFESDGTFVRAWGWGVADGISQELQTCTLTCFKGLPGSGAGQLADPVYIAVDSSPGASDPSKEDVYVGDVANEVIDKFSATGAYLGQIASGSGGVAFSKLDGVAVDPNGVVWAYVGEEPGQIENYSDEAPNELIASRPRGGPRCCAVGGFAVNSEDDLYVAHNGEHFIAKLDSAGNVIPAVGEELGGEETTGIGVDLADDNVFLDAENKLSEYSANGSLLSRFGARALEDRGGRGVAVSTAGAVYVADSRSDGIDLFTLGEVPKEAPKTEAAGTVLATSATLHGKLNPGGESGALEYQFDYNMGPSCTGGQSTAVGSVANAKEAPVEAKLTDLQPNAKYTYCLLAIDAFGEIQGGEVAFETAKAPPAVSTESVSGVDSTSATLEAQVNPDNQETHAYLQYSTSSAVNGVGALTTATATSTPPGAEVGANFEEHALEPAPLSGLAAGTAFYYQAVATNATGTTYGPVQSFATVPTPSTDPAGSSLPGVATLNGHFKLDATDTKYRFDYAEGSECTGAGTKSTPEADAGMGTTIDPVTVEITELKGNVGYAACLETSNAYGAQLGPAVTFTSAVLAPKPENESATEVTATSAQLNGEIDPGGAETTYLFQYGIDGAYIDSTSVSRPLPADNGEHAVSAQIDGLTANTQYSYRLVALHGTQTINGRGGTFTTQGQPSASSLPDDRMWELVSPPDKHGARLDAMTQEGGVIQAAEDGSAITYVADAPPVADPPSNPAIDETQLISTRGSAGWSTRDIATPRASATYDPDPGHFAEYEYFSPDLSLGLIEPQGEPTPLSPEASEKTPYLREHLREEDNGGYVPLVTAANTPPGTKFGEVELNVVIAGTSPDLRHVVLNSPAPLTPNTPGGLYEWSAGALQPVSILPVGRAASKAENPSLGMLNAVVRGAVSEDGDRVFWGTSQGQLYMREMSRNATIRLDRPQENLPESYGKAEFQLASPDGADVLFTDSGRLTGDSSPESGQGGDLYEYDVETGTLTDLTVTVNPGEPAHVEGDNSPGTIIGASEDLSSVYLVAEGVLTTAANERGQVAVSGANNLYAITTSGGRPVAKFIARLSGEDQPAWDIGYPPNLRRLTARVTPNGRYLTFMSSESLTGYDNHDAQSAADNATDEEVYLYDAESERLICASCNPTGARPTGVLDQEESGEGIGLLVDRPETWIGDWLAGSIPGWTAKEKNGADYQSRYLSNDGRLFFNAADGLLPKDVNGKEDVYEYEPEGVSGCTSSTSSDYQVFVAADAGCVGLVSSGTSSSESAFLDASGTGPGGAEAEDVFFVTDSQLSSEDHDTLPDVYDAHTCSPASPCFTPPASVPPPCATADACRVAETPQPEIFGPPPSATFSAPRNVAGSVPATKPKAKAKTVKCKRNFVKRKGKCLKKKARRRAGKTNRKGRK